MLDRLKKLGFSDDNIMSTHEIGTIEVAVKGAKAENGEVSYSLYVGESAVANVNRSRGKSGIGLFTTWYQIVIVCCIAVVIVLIILPEVGGAFRRRR